MKKIILSLVLLTTLISFADAQVKRAEKPPREKERIDEGEMKTYIMVFLKEGPNRKQTEKEAAEIQKNHLDHLTSMYQEGLLIMAGPFQDEQKIKGILVLNLAEIEQAKALINEDPAVKAGRLIAEYHLWYTKSGTVTLP